MFGNLIKYQSLDCTQNQTIIFIYNNMNLRLTQVLSVAAFTAVLGTTALSSLSASAQSTTNASLQVNGGIISIYAGDTLLNNDICSAADILATSIVEGITCNASENSIALPSIGIKPARQNPYTTLNDVIVDDLRGVSTSLYTVTAEFSNFVDSVDINKKIELGTNPDNGSGLDAGSITSINVGGTLKTINVTAGGSGYTSAPVVNINGGGGSGATGSAAVSGGVVTSVTISNPGAGYTSSPTVTLSGGAGTGATATSVLTSGGTGYTSAPTVTITGGSGTGATATATITSGVVTSVNITSPGTGYTSAPTVSLTGGAGSGASATATVIAASDNLSIGTVNAVTVSAGGTGYTTAPAVSLTGGAGTGATAVAVVSGGVVTSIKVTNPGTGYTSAPTVAITGGSGSGATATSSVTNAGSSENNIFITADPSIGTMKAISPASLSISGFNRGPRSLVTSTSTQYTLFTTGSTPHASGRFGIDGMRYGLRVPAYVQAGDYRSTIVQTVTVG
jgi:hypothetical protein